MHNNDNNDNNNNNNYNNNDSDDDSDDDSDNDNDNDNDNSAMLYTARILRKILTALTVRRKWTSEDNKIVMDCYYLSEPK